MGSHVSKIHVKDVLTENLHLEVAATCADDPCEAVLALGGVCNEVMVWGHHALPGTDAEVDAWEDSHLCGTQEAIVRERAGRSKGSMAQLPLSL